MRPVAFGDCFGWLHAPNPAEASDVAVIISAGLLRDKLLAHASFRVLADDLAAAGYWVLRFDYPGTGDSLDDAVERLGGHWAAWQDADRQAADWLKAVTGARRLVLGGLRAGATLATLSASRRDDVAALLLLEPVVSGRIYMRELMLDAELQGGLGQDREQGLDIREFHLGPDTLRQIGEVDLGKVKLPAGLAIAVFAQPNNRQLDGCIAAWQAAGLAVTHGGWDGLQPLMRHPVFDRSPLGDFGAVVRWLREKVPPGVAAGRASSAMPSTLQPAGCIEQPVRFGSNGKLFGILCTPEAGTADEVVLLLNGGRDPHYGAARQGVDFARSYARAGIASFRVDFAGLGDSVGPPGEERTLSETFRDRVPDVHTMIDALQAQGFRRFAAQGLCSGAYHAVQGALADPRIGTLLPINMPLFTLPRKDVLDHMDQRGFTLGFYLRKLVRPASWVTLLSGRSDLRGIWRMLLARGRAARERTRQESTAQQTLSTLAARGAKLLFLFSPGDADIENFAREFGAAGEKLAAYPGASMRIVPGMDHDLTRAAGRRDAARIIVEFLKAAPQ